MLEETVEAVRRLWTEPAVTFDGHHVHLDGALCDPKPLQDLPPVWIGGGGERVNPITAGAPRGVELAGDDLADFYRQKARIDRMRIASGRAPAPGSASAAAGLRPTV